ncbi:MAG: hypothetical protein LBO74_09505 [Candidatus Symbiothrix sp.]|jgi:hypothetical protein|nr:hypothetical protein [Candidatus Symbiothrix sp.]
MKTTKEKITQKESHMDKVIKDRIMRGEKLSAIAKYWLSKDGGNWEILDMKAVLK